MVSTYLTETKRTEDEETVTGEKNKRERRMRRENTISKVNVIMHSLLTDSWQK